jgi:hypothetical protein
MIMADMAFRYLLSFFIDYPPCTFATGFVLEEKSSLCGPARAPDALPVDSIDAQKPRVIE